MNRDTAAVQSAVDRLNRSRAQLHQALQAGARPPGVADLGGGPLPDTDWLVAAARRGWAQHPWHVIGSMVLAIATARVQPIARRHPWRLMGGALVLGGVLAWSRPWRWVAKPGWQIGLVQRLVSEALILMVPRADRS